jgi:diaminopimelate epimerase
MFKKTVGEKQQIRKLRSYKMSAQGNDFLLFDLRTVALPFYKQIFYEVCRIFCKINLNYKFQKYTFNKIQNNSIYLSDRNFGIGCDQIVILSDFNPANEIPKEFCKKSKFDAFIVFLNSDGSLSGACGNGTRCAAGYLTKKISIKKEAKLIKLQAIDRVLECSVDLQTQSVNVKMGKVFSDNASIPISNDVQITQLKDCITKICQSENGFKFNTKNAFCGNIGNPHCVIEGDFENYGLSVNQSIRDYIAPSKEKNTTATSNLFEVIKYWSEIIKLYSSKITNLTLGDLTGEKNNNLCFYQGVNIEFCELLSDDSVFFIVHERGSGITLSCGTGASVVGYYFLKKLQKKSIKVYTIGSFREFELLSSIDKNTNQNKITPLEISIDEEENVFMNGSYKFIANLHF